MHITVVLGTRPEVIKMAPVIHALRQKEGTGVSVILSGQHRELASAALAEFGISADLDLAVMREGQTPSLVTEILLSRLGALFSESRPDLVLVHGDTATAFSASLAAFYRGIPVGHIEAGLRTYCRTRPFPEEFYRRAIAAMAAIHFAPTPRARENLLREGVRDADIFCVGNTVVDALRYTVRADFSHPTLAHDGRLLFFTAHRRELDEGELCGLYRALARLTERFFDVAVLYPVHPRVEALARRELAHSERIFLLPPLKTADCHNLMARATLLLTDSGGMQEEACALGIPTLVLRRETERPEGVESGALRLVGTEGESLLRVATELLSSPIAYAAMRGGRNPYGDGHAAERIADVLTARLAECNTRVPFP